MQGATYPIAHRFCNTAAKQCPKDVGAFAVSGILGKSMRVLLTDPIDPQGERVLRSHGAQIVKAPDSAAGAVKRLAQEADAIIICSRLREDLFDAAPRIRAVTIAAFVNADLEIADIRSRDRAIFSVL